MFPLKDNIPTRSFPVVTVVLIALNVIAYVFLQKKSGLDFSGASLDPGALNDYAAVPRNLTHGVAADGSVPTWATPLTAMFTHAGLLHLGGNMLFLWIFGNSVEDAMGRGRFVAFYLLGGLAALALQVALGPDSVAPTLGASGAVAGVLGGYILLYPRARVVTAIFIILFVTLIEIPALVMLGFWFVQQAAYGALDLTTPNGGGGGVASFAHVGGFVFGLLAIRAFASHRRQIVGVEHLPVS